MSKLEATPATGPSASQLIDERIHDLGGWRGETLARMRALIQEADPEITEEWKWRGPPVWSHNGIVCTGETYTKVVKLTFARGAVIPDPSGLFNSSLEGNTRRAIDIHEGEKVDAGAFKVLLKACDMNQLVRLSNLCLIVSSACSSEERVLSTATFLTMPPFNPVNPACLEPLRVIR